MPSPEMQTIIERFRRRRQDTASRPRPALSELRAAFSPAPELLSLPGDVVSARERFDDPATYRLAAGAVKPDRAILYLHGGGFVLGSFESHAELAARISRAASSTVFLPEYRLAPEHPYPAALKDALRSWRSLRADGWRASSVVVVGDSAGGGLALSLALALRQQGEDLPAGIVAMSPVTDLTLEGLIKAKEPEADVVLTPELIQFLVSTYLAGSDPRSPLASPLLGELSGMPPALLQVGTTELLFADSERFAGTARSAGMDVTLVAVPEMPHVFPAMRGTPEAETAVSEIGGFVDRVLGTGD